MAPVKNILVPVDYSETAEHALAYAVELAIGLHARVHVVSAWEMPNIGLPDGLVVATADIVGRIVDAVQDHLRELEKKYKARVDIRTELVQGDPRDAILTAVERIGADLVVMGTHGRRGVARALMGSVAESVVRSCPVPVLTVRGRESAAPTRA